MQPDFQGNLTMINCTVRDNTGYRYGSGIANVQGHLNLTDCIVWNNTALGDGGGIYTEGGSVYILNSTITNNTAGSGGGISSLSVVTVVGSQVFGNTARGEFDAEVTSKTCQMHPISIDSSSAIFTSPSMDGCVVVIAGGSRRRK
jgi:predicted outer membrane repeat protein